MTDTNTAEREAFKAAHQHLDLVEMPDAWGRPAFRASHVEASWRGWQARASLAASAGSEPMARMASERDELFQAAIDFIRTLTGMEPPPIEVAPPDVFAPFHAFVNTVQAITNKRYRPPLGGVARPCHVFNVRKIGPRTEWTPTTMALALPDGEHALYTHPSPPEGMAGWKLVPVEPTEEMKTAAVKYANGTAVYKNVKAEVLRIEEGIYGEVYEAMIAAAPQPPASEAKEL